MSGIDIIIHGLIVFKLLQILLNLLFSLFMRNMFAVVYIPSAYEWTFLNMWYFSCQKAYY